MATDAEEPTYAFSMTETLTAQILEDVYQAGSLQLALLAHGAKDVFHVQRASAPDWIMRIYPVTDPAPAHDRVLALAQLLVFLEQHQYPAERVVRTIDGALTTRIGAWHVLVTTYLGSPLQVWQPASTGVTDPHRMQAGTAKRDPQLLYSIGALLGRLHALDTTGPDCRADPRARAPGGSRTRLGLRPAWPTSGTRAGTPSGGVRAPDDAHAADPILRRMPTDDHSRRWSSRECGDHAHNATTYSSIGKLLGAAQR